MIEVNATKVQFPKVEIYNTFDINRIPTRLFQTSYLIQSSDAIRRSASALQTSIFYRKFVIVGNLFPCLDVNVRKNHDFVFLSVIRVNCDNLSVSIWLATVVHEPRHAPNLGSVHDFVQIETEHVARPFSRNLVSFFASVRHTLPDDFSHVFDNHGIFWKVNLRKQTPAVNVRTLGG